MKENGSPARIRSYYQSQDQDTLLRECRIWEAARATSAASTFFPSIKIGRYQQTFIDGALLNNNPIEIADDESRGTLIFMVTNVAASMLGMMALFRTSAEYISKLSGPDRIV